MVLVVGLNTCHLALSVYVFGFVRPRRTLKVFHIYFGYALGVVIWASQTNLDNEPLHTYLTALMFAGIAVHLLLGDALRGPSPGRAARRGPLPQRMRDAGHALAAVSRSVGLTFAPAYVTTNRPFFFGR